MTNHTNILVALVPEVKDWAVLTEQLWYRIPQESAPPIIRDGQAEYIAFYHTAKFGQDLKWKIVFYAKIKRIVAATRKDLFPDESPYHKKANRKYWKVELDALMLLPQPIVSRRGHRIVFVPTTEAQFFSDSSDFNKIFKTSPLEKKMREIMDDLRLIYEREWCVHVDDKRQYHLDFAFFCRNGQIDVECDGDTYHMGYDNVYYDKTRNNELESYKWRVLRYTTKHFAENEKHIRKTLYKTVQEFGGCADESETMYRSSVGKDGQIKLF